MDVAVEYIQATIQRGKEIGTEIVQIERDRDRDHKSITQNQERITLLTTQFEAL